MKVLIIGGGGREHTLAWKVSQDNRIKKIYVAPGNGGTEKIAENIQISPENIDELVEFAKKKNIDLTIVGPEVPLSLGIVDVFEKEGLKIFGTDKKCSQLESSKDYSKSFMEKYNIPTAKYEAYVDSKSAIEGLKDYSYPLVIKADGLCAGKGVVICEDEKMAIETIEDMLDDKIFGKQGSRIIIEEFLDGIEASLLCLVSNNKIFPLPAAEDYKQIFDNDKGPNTGGIGCYSPSSLLKPKIYKQLEQNILQNIEKGFEEEDMNFTGVLFIGLMVVGKIPYVLEFNTRFGDPESQVVLPRLKNSLVDVIEKTIDGSLKEDYMSWDSRPAMTVILTSKGYPGEFETGFEITGLDDLDENIRVFHNGTEYKDGKYYTKGGRVLSITSMGDNLEEIRENIYKNIEKINFAGMYYRTDIGKNIEY